MEIEGLSFRDFEEFMRREAKRPDTPEEFAEVLKRFIDWVNSQQRRAEEVKEAVLEGEEVPLHRMIIEFEKASVALNLLIEIRNRLLEGFQELQRMQV
jgi:flagellar hook-basal body complex protein FliE